MFQLPRVLLFAVNDTESFRDDVCLYRFRQDDNTFPWHNDMKIFREGERLYHRSVYVARSILISDRHVL